MEGKCVNCDNDYMSAFDRYFMLLKTTGVAFTGDLQGCCDKPKKTTKNHIVLNIINDL